jgi:hypothetical protein
VFTFPSLFRPPLRSSTRVVPLEQRAAEVLKHHTHYWRGILLGLAGNTILLGAVVGGFWLVTSIFIAQNQGLKLPPFRFELPADSAMAAFGILATLIVALQVGVRVPFADERVPAAAARQISLETLAQLCGAGALAVGLAATLAQPAPWSTMDPIRSFGPVAGALLLAVFAGDAASASSARLSQAISNERRSAAIKRLAAARDALETSSRAMSPKGYAIQLIVGLIAIPIVVTSLFLALWGPDLWVIVPGSMLTAGVGCAILLGSVFLVATKALWTRRALLESAYTGALVLLFGATVVVGSFALQPGPWPSDFRDVFWRTSVAAVVGTTWVMTCTSLAVRLPFSKKRGVGGAILIRTFQLEIDRHARGPRPADLGVVGLILLSIALPPLGMVLASRRRVDRSRPVAALWVASATLCAWVSTVIILLVVNPSFS